MRCLLSNTFFGLAFFAFCLFTFAFQCCAKVGTLSGGEKDTRPPQLDTAHSTRPFSTRFSGKEIVMKFDEWVKLDNPAQQILISPPLAEKPEFKLKGKILYIKLPENEQLRPKTTYTVHFGNAVKDLSEGNAAKDLRLVFSTGDVIDSLSLGGSIVDAFSGQALEGISIFAYDNLADSVPSRERPLYFGKTDKSGNFKIENLRGGQFKIMAVEDKDFNYKMSDSERRGFLEQSIFLNDSSQKKPIRLQIFDEKRPVEIASVESQQFGLVKVKFIGKPLGTERPRLLNSLQFVDFEQVMDTLYLWSDFSEPLKIQKFNGDTLTVKPQNRADFLKKRKLIFFDDVASGGRRNQASNSKFSNQNSGRVGSQTSSTTANSAQKTPPKNVAKTISQNPSKPLELFFNLPVRAIDASKILFRDDSLAVGGPIFSIKQDSTSPRKWLLEARWREKGGSYFLEILPGALTDFLGETNSDTLRRQIQMISTRELGNLAVTSTDLTVGSSYVFELLSGETVTERRSFLAKSAENRLVFSSVQAGLFSGRLIEDANANGVWDSGSYAEKKQPERVAFQKFEALKSGFDSEAEIAAPGSDSKNSKKRFGK